MKTIKTLIIVSMLQSTVSFANECEPCDVSHRWWINFGIGVGTTVDHGGVGHNLGGAGQVSFNGMISDRMFVTLELTGTSGSGEYRTSASDVGILLGYKSKKPTWYWSGAAGIGHYATHFYEYGVRGIGNYSWTYHDGVYSEGFVIPLEAQIFWTPIKHIGLGLIAHGAASADPYGVLLLGVQFS